MKLIIKFEIQLGRGDTRPIEILLALWEIYQAMQGG